MNSPLIIGGLVASFLETSPLYPPLLEGEGVGGEVQAERIKGQYAWVWYKAAPSRIRSKTFMQRPPCQTLCLLVQKTPGLV